MKGGPVPHVHTLSLSFEPYTLLDQYSINIEKTLTIRLRNITSLENEYSAYFNAFSSSNLTVNDTITTTPRTGNGGYEEIGIDKTFSSPIDFLNYCPIFEDATKVTLNVEIEDMPFNANDEVTNLYKKTLAPEKLDSLLEGIGEELSAREKRRQVEGKLKTTLTRNIISYLDKTKEDTFGVKFLTLGALLLTTLILSHPISLALNLSANLLYLASGTGLATMFLTLNIGSIIATSSFSKKKYDIINKLGELENENIDTPESKKHLVDKLINILGTSPASSSPTGSRERVRDELNAMACSDAIELGQSVQASQQQGIFYRSFQLAKTFFSADALRPEYYVGQEMEKKRNSP
tara:strand:+ start:6314 stop:7363 length:1050 start_codon:yes stop_codon:yes gene_type:complete